MVTRFNPEPPPADETRIKAWADRQFKALKIAADSMAKECERLAKLAADDSWDGGA